MRLTIVSLFCTIPSIASCGGAQGHASSAECRAHGPEGDRAELTLAETEIEGARVDPPIGCEGAYYVRLWREGGERTIAMGRDASGAIRGCTEQPGELDDCPEVHADALFRDAARTLASQGIEVTGIGLGPCGDANGGYDEWRMSIAVSDWSQADAAVRALAGAMHRWDVRGQAGVAVRGPACGVELEARRAASHDG